MISSQSENAHFVPIWTGDSMELTSIVPTFRDSQTSHVGAE